MRERYLLLALLLLFFAALKWEFNPGLGRNSLDGDYYYQIARNVAEGRGFTTSVSLYHQGFRELPHATSIYPLWPLLLGFVAKAVPLRAAAVLLPELLFLVDLLLLYFLANRIQSVFARGEPVLLAGGRTLDLGHVAVLLFGFNPVFFNFTSLPYTEALAFAFTFGALIAAFRAVEGRGRLWAALAGALAGAAYLTRSQMLLVVVALVAAFAAAGLRERRLLPAAGLAALGAGVVVLPWIVYLARLVEPFDPWVLVHFERYREIPEIARFDAGVRTSGWWQYFADRLPGLWAAIDPWSRVSYVASFGLAAWLAPLALFRLATHHEELGGGLRASLGRRALPATVVLVSGLLLVAPLQLYHASFLSEWRFHHRHGLPLLLVLLVALGYLLTRGGRPTRAAALVLLASSVVWGAFSTVHLLNVRYPSGLLGAEPELVEWLDGRPRPPSVLTTNVQTLSVFSRAGFHWMDCREPAETTRQLVELAGVEYVVLYPGEERCPFAAGLAGAAPVAAFGEVGQAIRVFDVRRGIEGGRIGRNGQNR